LEDELHQRIEAGARLIEQVELDVGCQRRHECDFLPVPLRVGAAFLAWVELEPLQQCTAPCAVETSAQGAEEVDHLTAGEVRPQADLARHVRKAAMQHHRVPPRVRAEDGGFAAVSAQQPEQDPNSGRLACAVRPEEAMYLAAAHGQVELVERPRRAELLDDTGEQNGRSHFTSPRLSARRLNIVNQVTSRRATRRAPATTSAAT
jgi:hypothetical protein